MRLKPPVSAEDAFHVLLANATLVWGEGVAPQLTEQLRTMAAAMATISALEIPEDTEPLFAEDIALDPIEATL